MAINNIKNTDSKKSKFPFIIINVVSIITLSIFLFIIIDLFVKGSPTVSMNFLTEGPKNNLMEGGIGPAVFGTFFITVFMIIMAVPVGISAAIFINEYSKDNWITRILKISVNNLAGVPSIVFGLFGMGFFVLLVGKNLDEIFNSGLIFGQPSMLWASATLAVLILPTIIIPTIHSLNAVPQDQKDAAYGLGASKWQVIRNVILPQAKPGIMTGIILAVIRGAGETAPILFLGCAFFLPDIPMAYLDFGIFEIPMVNPMEQFMHLGYHIFILTTQSAKPLQTIPLQYGTALVLFTLILLLNITAIYFRYRSRKLIDQVKFKAFK